MSQPDRSTYLGSSDIAAVLGISPWKTPYAVWEHKCYGITEQSDEQRDKILRRGQLFEPIIIDMLMDEYDYDIPRRNVRYSDPKFPFLQVEIDAEEEDFDGNVRNVEIKSVSQWSAKEWGAQGTDEIPIWYTAQVQFALMVTGRKETIVAALVGTDDLRHYVVQRDEEIIKYIRECAVQFWNKNVLERVPPPLKDADDAEKMMARFDGITLIATDEMRKTIKRLLGVKKAIKRLEDVEKETADAIKTTLARSLDFDGEQTPGKTAITDESGKVLVSWNPQTTKRLSVSKVRDLHPSVFDDCTDLSTYRVMRLKEKAI
jgi:putative phage-type endonuclease